MERLGFITTFLALLLQWAKIGEGAVEADGLKAPVRTGENSTVIKLAAHSIRRNEELTKRAISSCRARKSLISRERYTFDSKHSAHRLLQRQLLDIYFKI